MQNNSAVARALFSGGQNNRAITIWDLSQHMGTLLDDFPILTEKDLYLITY